MKKFSLLTVITMIVFLFASSCRKEQNGITITRVIDVSIAMNETYTNEIPHTGDADDVMQISKQASHYLASEISAATGGNVALKYTPALNYTGTDEVIVNNTEDGHGKGGHGNCQGGYHHDDTVIYDFKITISGTTTRNGK